MATDQLWELYYRLLLSHERLGGGGYPDCFAALKRALAPMPEPAA